jgi:hypothetical protein
MMVGGQHLMIINRQLKSFGCLTDPWRAIKDRWTMATMAIDDCR